MNPRAIDPDTIQSRFGLALNARVEYAFMSLLATAERWYSPDIHQHRANAQTLAWHCGHRYADERLPSFFEDDEELRGWWIAGVNDKAEEDLNAIADADEQRRRAQTERMIQLEDWTSLGLPGPQETMDRLRSGESCEVKGHSLHPDLELNAVWFTNPYGQDGFFAHVDELTEATVEKFLRDMARGDEYGPVPH